jgi:uncharacterized repeat protein (TIGR01451 family)
MIRLHSAALIAMVALLCGEVRGANPVQTENALAGTTAWQLTNPATNREIEGYASLTSVAQGSQIGFFVSTADSTYTLAVYRMGFYAGNGGRLMTSSTLTGRVQATPTADPLSGLAECNWTQSMALTIPASWISGVYLAKLTGLTSGKQSYIVFVVREDSRASALLFDSSVTTFEAYNNWPYPGTTAGKSLYSFNSPTGPAAKVSFNRPYAIDSASQYFPLVGSGYFLRWEYNMVRFLESSGYDVTYASSVDLHENVNLALNHKGLLLMGHDEYWSWQMRANVIAARDSGVNLGFFASNVCYWQIRLENSVVNSSVVDRTIVAYKASPQNDPVVNKCFLTNLWRDNTCVASEETFIGVQYVEDPVNTDLVVADQTSWVLAGTGLTNGATLPGLIGYEADGELAGNSPAGTAIVMHSPIPVLNPDAQKYPFSDMTAYTASSGATVFATGSMQFSWGLDDYGAPQQHASVVNPAAQQLTRNVLARLGTSPNSVAGAPVSDTFTGTTLNTSLWTFVNPVGDGTVTQTGAQLRLGLPAGSVHDVWSSGDSSARIMQAIGNVDFEVAVKFDSTVSSFSQMEGIIVEQDSSTFLRFDFRHDGVSPRLFAASIAGGAGTFRVDIPLSSGLAAPLWLKVKRTGSAWTESWSTDGTNYTVGGAFTLALSTSKIGLFAGNYGNPASAAPALTVLVDSFLNTAATGGAPDLTITKSHTGTFTQGGTGVYTITASNAGTAATSGAVTVTEALPTGLTASAFSGTGWTCGLTPQVSCTRNDALAAGAVWPVLTLTVGVAANAPASVINSVTISGGGDTNALNNTASDATTIGSSGGGGAGAPVSDDFNTTALNTSLWTFVNPVGNGTVTVSGGDLKLTVPAGSVHDIWSTGDNSARVMQPVMNSDFEVAVKFDSSVTGFSQMQGIIVEQDSNTFLRFDFRHDGNGPRLFAAGIAGGTGTFLVDIPLGSALAPPLWLKVKRAGNAWTESWSTDGANYTSGGTFTYALSVAKMGPFAGNYGNPASAAPAMTAAVDYFYNTATAPVAPDMTVTKTHSGSFTAGATGVYSIVARNSGTGPTSGTVTVTDSLPAGLTAASFAGTGWTCAITPTVACTRSDALAAATSYPTLTLTVNVGAAAPASVTNVVTVSGGGETNTANNTASDPTTIGSTSGSGAPVSDEFNVTSLNASLWTLVNPVGNGSILLNGSELRLTVPAGSAHDLWTTGDNSVRVLQPIGNVDFEVVIKFDSAVTSFSQMEGIVVEQDSSNYLRFDIRHDGNSPRLFAASITPSTGTFLIDLPLSTSLTQPVWLKVRRSGNSWTESWSTDGTAYATGGTFNYTLTATKVGPFAGNYGNPASAAPAMTAAVDYFHNTATNP